MTIEPEAWEMIDSMPDNPLGTLVIHMRDIIEGLVVVTNMLYEAQAAVHFDTAEDTALQHEALETADLFLDPHRELYGHILKKMNINREEPGSE